MESTKIETFSHRIETKKSTITTLKWELNPTQTDLAQYYDFCYALFHAEVVTLAQSLISC